MDLLKTIFSFKGHFCAITWYRIWAGRPKLLLEQYNQCQIDKVNVWPWGKAFNFLTWLDLGTDRLLFCTSIQNLTFWILHSMIINVLGADYFLNLSERFLNSHAVGMVAARPYGFRNDFLRNPISESAAWFFVIILEFIFTPIFEINIHGKNSLTQKKFHFRRSIFIVTLIAFIIAYGKIKNFRLIVW